MSFRPENIQLTGTQAAGFLVMVALVVFPPALFFWTHVNLGSSPLRTLTLVGAVGGGLASLLLNWPRDRRLTTLAGTLSGAGSELAVIALSQWSPEAIRLKVPVFLALVVGAGPGYVIYRWAIRSRSSTTRALDQERQD